MGKAELRASFVFVLLLVCPAEQLAYEEQRRERQREYQRRRRAGNTTAEDRAQKAKRMRQTRQDDERRGPENASQRRRFFTPKNTNTAGRNEPPKTPPGSKTNKPRKHRILGTRSNPSKISQTEPEFAEPIQNITVPAGRKVTLACVVDNLNNYRVAWMFVEKFTLLTLAKSVITHNSRFKVTHNGHRTWHLHIHDVQERDRGAYMCQINTSPMKSQIGYLNVVVPPKIDEENTSSDTEVREGGDVALKCIAKGTPEPEITWRREDDQDIAFGREKVSSVKGTWLNITKVSRLHMSAYLCIASNGVLPSVSKRIILEISFAPMIWIPNQLVGASVETDVTLDCNLESHPKSVTYWTRNTDTIIHQNAKYSVLTVQHAMYKVQMQLVVRRLKPEDFGEYHCVAKNSLGETEGTIKLYEIPASSSSTSHSPEAFRAKSEKLRNGQMRNSLTRPHDRAIPTSRPRDLSELSTDQRPSYTPAVVKLGDFQSHGNAACPSPLPSTLLLVAASIYATSVFS